MGFLDWFRPKPLELLPPNVPASWAEDGLWRSWPPPLDVVRGESYHQDDIYAAAGARAGEQVLLPVAVTFTREPSNRYDKNAIRAEVAGHLVGYMAREYAAQLAGLLDSAGCSSFAVAGLIRGNRMLGVHVWFEKQISPGVGIHVTKDRDAMEVAWPPRSSKEGVDQEARENGRGNALPHMLETVKELKRRQKYDVAEQLLLEILADEETEAKERGWGVAPAPYYHLAVIYRKQRRYDAEVELLQRFARQPHAPGAMPDQLLERLEKAKSKRTTFNSAD